VALALFAVSSMARAQTAAEWDKIVAAAKQEAKVVVYSGAAPASTPKPVARFQEKYGIAVDILIGRGGEIRERARTEVAVGRAIGDVVLNGISTIMEQATGGDFQQHGPLPSGGRIQTSYINDGILVPGYATSWAMLVNTNLVKPGEEPKSWRDLADPKWKGKILVDNPLSPGGGQATFTVFLDKFGRGFLEQMAAQNLMLSEQYTLAEPRLARGEFAIYMPFIVSNIFNLRGLPVRGVAPIEGKTFSYQAAAILKNAPHPNAARLFLEFMLGDEAQDMFVDLGYSSPTGRVSAKIPDDLKPLMSAPLFAFATPARQIEVAPELQKLFQK
jgi:iron(III) transport system substrate-binding protein